MTSANSNAFQAAAVRVSGTRWTGGFTIDDTGLVAGTLQAAGEPDMVAGFQ